MVLNRVCWTFLPQNVMSKGNKTKKRRETRDVPNPTLFCTMGQQAQAEKDGSWHVDSFKNTYIVHRYINTEQQNVHLKKATL